jgi:hypothetical protein
MRVATTGSRKPVASGRPGRAGADELHAGEIAHLVSQFLGCRDDVLSEQLKGYCAGFDGRRAGEAQHARGFDQAVLGLGCGGSATCQYGSGRILRVQCVALAAQAAIAAIRPVHLEDLDACIVQVARDARPVTAGALDPDLAHVAETAHPAHQGAVAGACGRERLRGQDDARGVEHGGHVQVLVRVDPTPTITRLAASRVVILTLVPIEMTPAHQRKRTRQ